jgi:tetraacyldisaccharide 4'-kinase
MSGRTHTLESTSLNARDKFHALVSGKRGGIGPALQRGALRLASLPYGCAVSLRNRLFDWGWKRSHVVPLPVVSIGNLTLGGTGKTPCVEYVAAFFRDQGLRVCILSRGYGATGGSNDEALVLEENLPDVPHLQGADRVTLAKAALEELESEVLVLDDGFQHRRLHRNLDVVLLDATNPWGHDHLFPGGLLREPVRGLRRADVIVVTRSDQVDRKQSDQLRSEITRIAPDLPVAETVHQPVDLIQSGGASQFLELLKEKATLAFCGLGNPEAFRQTLLQLGAVIKAFRTFPDHHAYSRSDVEELRTWVRQQGTECIVVTTQKDLVKLRLTQLGGYDLYALRVRLHFTAGQEVFDQKLLSVVG